jgi:hypothetical protein
VLLSFNPPASTVKLSALLRVDLSLLCVLPGRHRELPSNPVSDFPSDDAWARCGLSVFASAGAGEDRYPVAFAIAALASYIHFLLDAHE